MNNSIADRIYRSIQADMGRESAIKASLDKIREHMREDKLKEQLRM